MPNLILDFVDYILIILLISILFILFNIITYKSNFQGIKHTYFKYLNKLLGIMVVSIFVWTICLFILNKSKNVQIVEPLVRLSFVAPLVFLYAFQNFINIYTSTSKTKIIEKQKMLHTQSTPISQITNILNFVLIILFIFTKTLISDVDIIETRSMPIPKRENLFVLYIIYIILVLVLTYRKLVLSIIKEVDQLIKYEKLTLLLITIIPIIGTMFTNLLLPIVLKQSDSSRLAPVSLIIFIFGIYYLIIKYQFLDIRIFVGKALYYILSGVLAYISFYLTLFFLTITFGSPINEGALITGLIIAIIFVIVFNEYNKYVLNKVSSKIISPYYNPTEEIQNFNQNISTVLNLDIIQEKFYFTINKTIRPYSILLTETNTQNTKNENSEKNVSLKEIYPLIEKISHEVENNIIYYLDNQENYSTEYTQEIDKIREFMHKFSIDILSWITKTTQIAYIIMIINKNHPVYYNDVEKEFINAIIKNFSLAMSRALLYQEVQNFNKELKEKINKATLQLKQKNRKLKELIKFQKDIMDIMGHELRTPLGITRNALLSLNLARQKATDNKVDISQFESMMDVAIRNIEREIDLVETILTSAKIDNAKLVLNTKKVNLIKILEEVYQSYQEPAEKKKLWIKKEFTEPEISIEGDEIRLYQVFNNLVSNAVKYTNQGGVTIKAYKHRENSIVEIIDTGEGIPKESIEKLGKKFYRVNNYINKSQNTETIQNLVVRPGGTGLGLYVTFELTRLMKGEIKVTSKLGEGSNFTVIFPLVKSEQKTS